MFHFSDGRYVNRHFDLDQSALAKRLRNVVPGGAHTYSRGNDQFPANAPALLQRGLGANVWDSEGNKYIDYGMGLRAVTIGYANARVNAAAARQMNLGNCLTRASLTELEAAERFVSIIPTVDMVKFAKNGSSATTAAVKLARAFTGRPLVGVPRQHPFFSFDDWFIGTTKMDRGVDKDVRRSVRQFDFGDVKSIAQFFDENPNQVAAVIMEPSTSMSPCDVMCTRVLTAQPRCAECPRNKYNFLIQAQELCRKNGALLILDEMITGFRWNIRGAAWYFGVEPDLLTFGKGMANGFSVAAVAGRRDVMDLGSIDTPGEERVFFLSSTHGAEMSGLGAFMETMAIYEEQQVTDYLWRFGRNLRNGLDEISRSHGLEANFEIIGPDIALSYGFRNSEGADSAELKTLFMQELIRGGVLMPWISPSFAHTSTELRITLDAANRAFKVVAAALETDCRYFLMGDPVKPVFRKYN